MLASSTGALLRALAPATASIVPGLQNAYHAIYDVGNSTNIKWHEGMVSSEQKEDLLGQKGCVLWFTGLSGSGKSTVACTLEHALLERGRMTALLDGDNVRHGLNKNLGFSAEDREENIRRIGEVGKLFADQGIITLVSFISPYRCDGAAAVQHASRSNRQPPAAASPAQQRTCLSGKQEVAIAAAGMLATATAAGRVA